MNLVAKCIWAAVSVGLAFGLNVHMQPKFVAAYERHESGDAVGKLVLNEPPLELPTLAAHVVVEDVAHLNKVYAVRELSVRSQSARGSAPSFELFAALPDNLGLAPGSRPAATILLQLELAVQSTGRLGGRESFVQRDSAQLGRVVAGTFQFTDLRKVDDDGKSGFRGDARVELQVERERGVDLLTGRWSGPLIWE